MGNNHKHHHVPKAANSLQDECIRVPKVYDWVTDTLTVTKQIAFTEEQLEEIECAMEDPSLRPLRIVFTTPDTPPVFPLNRSGHHHDDCDDLFCEQVGEKRDVTVPVNGEFVDAQLVDLLFTADVVVKVVDRHGDVVTALHVDASVLESFVLCYPDGTDLMCRISKVFARIPTGTVLLNSPAPRGFNLEITFCVDVQVEAEVKLEVMAKFCSPRENNIIAPENVEQCPPITFPEQCPDIFPVANCECQATGEASGNTGSAATERGEAGIFVNVCPNCSLVNSQFRFTFDDRNTADGLKNIDFTATDFDQQTLECGEYKGGSRLMISGRGETNKGRVLDFNLAIVDKRVGKHFQVVLINPQTNQVVFDTDDVRVNEGDLTVKDCVTFKDLKYK